MTTLRRGLAAGARYPGSKPIIRVAAGQIDRLATDAETALVKSGLPVFQRGPFLVRPWRGR